MAVHDSAISTLAGVSSVYIVNDGKIKQQAVTLGVRQGDQWEILDGVKGDETLAASRLNELASGTSVELDKGSPGGEGGRKGGGGKSGKGGGRGKREGGSK